MHERWQSDYERAEHLFNLHLRERLLDYFGGFIIPTTTDPDSDPEEHRLGNFLDHICATDYCIQGRDGRPRALACRIQWRPAGPTGRWPYNSFTIRAIRDSGVKTELDKLRESNDGNTVGPTHHLQAYFTGTTLDSAAVAKTKDILKALDRFGLQLNRTTNAAFAVAYWDQMEEAGMRIVRLESLPVMRSGAA